MEAVLQDRSVDFLPSGSAPTRRASPAAAQNLPFTVSVVRTQRQLEQVQTLRGSAYGHHLPALKEAFARPEAIDRHPDVVIFQVQDKETGRTVGSARVQVNRSEPLQIERSVLVPSAMEGQLLAEITRLTVLPGYVPPVRLALLKATLMYCNGHQVAGILAGSRQSLMRQYTALGFTDLHGDDRMVPLAHAGGLPHRVLFLDVVTGESMWRSMNHPGYTFVYRTYHPDIAVLTAGPIRIVDTPVRQRPVSRVRSSGASTGLHAA